MKLLKLNTGSKLITGLLFIFLSTSLFAQNKGMVTRANNQIEKINSLIESEDKALALTKDQMKTMKDLTLQKMQAISEFRKANGSDDKEGIREIQKEYNTKIFKETMSSEQMKAYRTAQKKAKE